ncbi:MAG TPA: ROK family transcriptional regulator [Pyrinomonadaceae bacterium]|jgi:predicted NBD/HSP70 family sugar kinase|nr:ROK family transcriptional regulator [Pyrinomonadaceae bacterium]
MRRIDLTKAQAARSSTIRDINRQIVLNYIRDREPISRADIARVTEMQRSTVSNIVEGLKSDGLIEEIGAGVSTGGRRPTLLRLRAAGATAIGIDITPSSTTVATSDLVGRVLEREDVPNSMRPDEMAARIIECVSDFADRDRYATIAGVGVSLPGLVDPDTGRAVYIPYFKWRDWAIAEEIERATGLKAVVDNDANAAALAELWFGRPEVSDSRDFILALVAEGIGTGIVIDGQIYRGERGAAGEFGHMIVGPHAPVACSCGNLDCWEAFSSERAAVARYLRNAGLEDDGAESARACFREVVERALGGEQAAIDALTETAHYLGIGISNLIVGLSPAAVVVSGHITRAWPLIAPSLEETIQRSIRRGLPSARIVASTLSEPTLLGAISLVLSRKFGLAEV